MLAGITQPIFFYQYHIYLSCVKLPITNKFLQFNLGEFADNFAIPTILLAIILKSMLTPFF